MRSHILEGKVSHRRAKPIEYALEHNVFYFALDLAELDEVAGSIRLIGHNRRNVLEFRDADHWPEPAANIRETLLEHLRGEGEDHIAGLSGPRRRAIACGGGHHEFRSEIRP